VERLRLGIWRDINMKQRNSVSRCVFLRPFSSQGSTTNLVTEHWVQNGRPKKVRKVAIGESPAEISDESMILGTINRLCTRQKSLSESLRSEFFDVFLVFHFEPDWDFWRSLGRKRMICWNNTESAPSESNQVKCQSKSNLPLFVPKRNVCYLFHFEQDIRLTANLRRR